MQFAQRIQLTLSDADDATTERETKRTLLEASSRGFSPSFKLDRRLKPYN
jgi:hypothetical protein